MNQKALLWVIVFFTQTTFWVTAQQKNLQYWRPEDKRGLNVFEHSKQDTTAFEGVMVRIGGSNTMQFQALEAQNSGNVRIYDLGPDFNLATANLDIDAQLYPGLRMHLRTYLSSRNHPQPNLKGGYLQVDRLHFIREGFLDNLMDKITVKVGHMEVNYGDNHFRRSDNGQAIFNPFVGNYIMDSFTTEIGGEIYYQQNGFLVMAGATNGRLDPSVVRDPNNEMQHLPSIVAKAGYDRQINSDLRVRLTGSVYHAQESEKTYLYIGDRAGARYYNVLTTNPREILLPRFDPVFTNELTAIMINAFVKYQGFEYYGVFENASGKSVVETERRTINQFGTELLYRIGAQEKFYLGARHNFVTGQGISGGEIGIERFIVGGGWFLTKNVLAKAEYVNQRYAGFPKGSVLDKAQFSGIMLEAVVSF